MNATNGQATMKVEFFVDAVADASASAAAGRTIFRDIERVRISTTIGGNVVVKNIDDHVVARFPEEWARFRARRRVAIDGTPLEDWAVPGPAGIAELQARGIATVEELANLGDEAVRALGAPGPMWQARAKAFLDAGARDALVTRLVADNDALRREVADLGRRNAGLAETLERLRLNELPPDRAGQGVIIGSTEIAEQFRGGPMRMPAPVSSLDAIAARPPRPAGLPTAPELPLPAPANDLAIAEAIDVVEEIEIIFEEEGGAIADLAETDTEEK